MMYFSGYEESQRKKDGKVASRMSHLEPRSIQEEDNNKLKCKTKDVDNHVDNPQDDPGKASGADNGDTGNSTFPADSKSKELKQKMNKLDNRLFRKDS